MADTPPLPSLEQAVGLLEAGQTQQAISLLEALTRADAANVGLWLNLGQAYNRIGARQEAVIALKRATQLRPDAAPAWVGIGVAYGFLNQHAQAVHALERAVALGDDSGHAHLNLARALALVGRNREAVAAARCALDKLPGNDHAAYGLALALRAWAHDAGNPEPARAGAEALAALRGFLQAFPDSALAPEARDACAENTGDADAPLREDMVALLHQACAQYDEIEHEYGGRWGLGPIVFEIGTLVQGGLNLDTPDTRYTLYSLPEQAFSGAQLLAYLYAGARRLTIAVDLGIDLRREYDEVMRTHTPPPRSRHPADPL
jgi:tetratricopeptide (TPR) repeat protein